MYSRRAIKRPSGWQLAVRLWRRLSEYPDATRPDSVLWYLLGVDVFTEEGDA